eukprot:817207-Pyramimonas_sp.AAC.1
MRTPTFPHRSSRAFALSPGRIFEFTISWMRMPAALCRVRACHSAAEMFFACAFDEATTKIDGESGVSLGQ